MATFTNWSRTNKPSPLLLATSGLWCLNKQDRVKCFFCGGIIHTWQKDDNPDEEHAKNFPECSFLNDIKGPAFIKNIQQQNIQQQQSDICRLSLMTPENLSNSNQSNLPVILTKVAPNSLNQENTLPFLRKHIYPHYETYSARKASFPMEDNFVYQNSSSNQLAEAGFFCFKFFSEDHILCHSCGFGIKRWPTLNVNFMLLHCKFRTRCSYINSDEAKQIIARNTSNQTDDTDIISTTKRVQPSRDMSDPVTPIYDSFHTRKQILSAFNYLWGASDKTLDDTAQAGFFYSYINQEAGIYCFHCGNKADGWLYADDVAKEHTYFYPRCGWIAYRDSPEYKTIYKDIQQLNATPKIKLDKSEFEHFYERMATFIFQWPNIAQCPSSENLVIAGLFFYSVPDIVQCFKCSTTFKGNEFTETPILKHAYSCPQCPFIQSDEGQRLITLAKSNPHQQEVPYDYTNSISIHGTLRAKPDIDTSITNYYPGYASFSARKKSFTHSDWPHAKVPYQDPTTMALAGFFFKRSQHPETDTVYCFQSDHGGLSNWQPSDHPDEEHYKHFPQCPYTHKRRHETYPKHITMSFNSLGCTPTHPNTEAPDERFLASLPPVTLTHNTYPKSIIMLSNPLEYIPAPPNTEVSDELFLASIPPSTRTTETINANQPYRPSGNRCDPNNDTIAFMSTSASRFVMPSDSDLRQSIAAQSLMSSNLYSSQTILMAIKHIAKEKESDTISTAELAIYLYSRSQL
ncbi:MAG: hypothetical protein KAG53_03055 [Endozoicomonadaceae bacterium]|nr:hypothetical protein [Endozoicomonadaceae bacterium]